MEDTSIPWMMHQYHGRYINKFLPDYQSSHFVYTLADANSHFIIWVSFPRLNRLKPTIVIVLYKKNEINILIMYGKNS